MAAKRIRRALLVGTALLALASSGQAVELYLKVSSGLVRSRFGDIDQALQDWSASWEAQVAKLAGWGFEQTGRLRQSGCTSFGAEIVAKFGGRWAVGMGLGLIYSNFAEADAPLYVQKPGATIEYSSPTKVAAYPIYGFGQYAFPFAKRWEATLIAGMGFAPAKYIHREKFRDLKDPSPGVSLSEIASSSGAFLFLGSGLHYIIDPGLSLFAEAGYVVSEVSPFEGKIGTDTTGVLYYFQEYDSVLGLWQTRLRLRTEDPSGLNIRAVRKANIDLSGPSLRLGLMMKF